MKSFFKALSITGFALALSAGVSLAADKTAAAPKMSAEQEKEMLLVQQRMTPGVAHQVLKPLAGNWNYTTTMQMGPDAKPETTTGTSKNTLVYGDRFIKQEVTGTFMGKPFEGTGYMGYDNVKEKYVSVWIDSMMTGIMSETGDYDVATKTIKFAGKNSCPLTGEKEMACRSELTIVDADHITYSAYGNDPKTGKEFKGMEIHYTRA